MAGNESDGRLGAALGEGFYERSDIEMLEERMTQSRLQVDLVSVAATFLRPIPEIIWEAFLGIHCTWKGFRPESPILQPDARKHLQTATPAAAPA